MNTIQSERPVNTPFEFVQALAGELSAGNVELPSFPEIAVRVRRILADPKSTSAQVVRVVGSEPALAARLVRISNSASFNRSGRPVVDVRTAVNRLGYNMVRSAAMSFAMGQIRKASKLAGIERDLDDLWQRCTLVAAYAFVLARTCSRVNPDEAMLGGMMHSIGKLYVLTRAVRHPELFADRGTLGTLINDWHASIGKAILENWGFSDEMAAAVGEQEDHDRTGEGEADLRDVLAIAILMASHAADVATLEAALQGLPAAGRLGLTQNRLHGVVQECAAEVAALTSALGG